MREREPSMLHPILGKAFVAAALVTMAVTPDAALAGNGTAGWGTTPTRTPATTASASSVWAITGGSGGPTQTQLSSSIANNETATANAADGRAGSGGSTAFTACGYCVFITITGDANSINGNSFNGSNSGSITNNGTVVH